MKEKLYRLRIKATCFEEVVTEYNFDQHIIQTLLKPGSIIMDISKNKTRKIYLGEDLMKQSMIFIEEKPDE